MVGRDALVMEEPIRARQFDAVIEGLMLLLLAFAPLAMGAVEAWSEFAVVCVAGAMLLCLCAKFLLVPRARFHGTWAYLAVGAFLVTAMVQLLELPAGAVSAISPHTAAEKTNLLGDLDGSAAILSRMTLSFYPAATRHDLRMALAVAAVFVVAVNVYRRPESIRRLLGGVAILGGLLATLALAQVASGTNCIYWLIPTGNRLADGGAFVNHSHYCQFMNLCLGAAAAMLILRLRDAFAGQRATLADAMEILSRPEARATWALAGMIVLGAASIMLSFSRGGAVAMLTAASFTVVLLTLRHGPSWRGWVTAMTAVAAFACVLYVGFDAVYERLSTLRNHEEYAGRWQILKDVSVAWTKFPVLGTGLGTHETVYPMFDRSTIPAVAAHAENEYAQAAEETGIAGLAALLAFGAIIAVNFVRCIRRGRPSICSAAYGLGMGLFAILIQSLSDFGQHIPANAFLTAVTCGLLCSLGDTARQADATGVPAQGEGLLMKKMRLAPVAASLIVLAIFAWACSGAWQSVSAESAWKEAMRADRRIQLAGDVAPATEYANLVSNAAAAVAACPDDANYRFWLGVYRWRELEWLGSRKTDVTFGRQRMECAVTIVQDLNCVRILCPTYGPAYSLMGQVELFVLNRGRGAEHIRMGRRLAPCNPSACYAEALLSLREGDESAALDKFSRTLQLDESLFDSIADIYLVRIHRPDLALKLASGRFDWLAHVAAVLEQLGQRPDLVVRARDQAAETIRARCAEADAPAPMLAFLADISRRKGEYDAAAEYYRRALAANYDKVAWRMNLAECLARQGDVDDAIHEARVCLRLSPKLESAEKLIAEMSVRRTGAE
jgi:tetratricopeptide (TPR) repeat protein